ncbi:hypothetical protein LCGC14_0867140 [marine sediment metagenome]|uniref:Uncharacterized protein n=1 Tax=marine sediment metagenome TaxID=412755 RepID=A0A0F9PAN5_9ZZZZ
MLPTEITQTLKEVGAKEVESRPDDYLEKVTWYYVTTPNRLAGAVERYIFNNYSHYITLTNSRDSMTMIRFAASDV